MSTRWIERAFRHYGGPVIFHGGLYILLGLAFMLGSLYLDPDMGHIGVILMLVGVGMFSVFLVLAYRSYRGGRR